jgi:hypothetical protein
MLGSSSTMRTEGIGSKVGARMLPAAGKMDGPVA